MSNMCALKPPAEVAEPKVAQAGTIMLRRSDAFAVVRKLIYYAERNIEVAKAEGRQDDADAQLIRLRTLRLVRDGLKCAPEFLNPADAQAIEARRAATTKIGAVEDESAVAASETPKTSPATQKRGE